MIYFAYVCKFDLSMQSLFRFTESEPRIANRPRKFSRFSDPPQEIRLHGVGHTQGKWDNFWIGHPEPKNNSSSHLLDWPP